MALMCRAPCGGSAVMNSSTTLALPCRTGFVRPIVARNIARKPQRVNTLCKLSQSEKNDRPVQSQEASQLPTQQQFVKHKLAAFEAQRLARYNTIMEAQTVAHLEKLDRVIAKATKRSQERQANQYTLEAKAKLLEKQQEQIQSTLQELDNEQSDVRRRHDFCLRQANHNKTQTGRAQEKASKAKKRSARIQQQLWAAQQELGSLDKLRSSHEEEDRSPAEQALFEAIMRMGTVLEKPLRPAFSAVQQNDEKLAWVEDPEVMYL